MSECVLVLIANRAVEEVIADWLLEHQNIDLFGSEPIDYHGIEHHRLNLAEQVAGRQRKVMFQVRARFDEAQVLVEEMREGFSGIGIDYWIIPVLASGSLE